MLLRQGVQLWGGRLSLASSREQNTLLEKTLPPEVLCSPKYITELIVPFIWEHSGHPLVSCQTAHTFAHTFFQMLPSVKIPRGKTVPHGWSNTGAAESEHILQTR